MALLVETNVIFAASGLLVILLLLKRYLKEASPYSRLPNLGRQFLLGNAFHFAFMKSTKDVPELSYYLQTVEGFAHLLLKEGMCFVRFGSKKVLLLYTPQTIEPLLSSKTEIDKAGAYKPAEPILGEGLLICRAKRWRKTRKLVSPAFNNRVLEDFLPIMNSHSRTFVSKIGEKAGKIPVDIAEMAVLCTYDIILETAMGTRTDVQNRPDDEMLRAMKRVLEVWVARTFRIFLKFDFIFNMLPMAKAFYADIKSMDDICKEVIDKKKAEFAKVDPNCTSLASGKDALEESRKRQVFIDLLLQHQQLNSDYTDQEIIKESLTFIGAGHDTTAYTVAWSLFLIGHYPKVQDKIYDELRKVFGSDRSRPVTPDDLKQLEYLECAIKETLRVYPSIPMISRKLKNELKIGHHVVPRNTNCVVVISALHKLPWIYPDPELFDPNRFLPENSANISQFAFIPFSGGPRVCIGQKYALMEAKLLVADLLRNYEVHSIEPRDKIVVVPHVVGKPHKPILVNFTLRPQ